MAFTTIQGSGANDATSFVGSSGVDSINIQNQSGSVFLGAQEANDAVAFANFTNLVSGYTMKGGQGNDTFTSNGQTVTLGARSFLNGNSNVDTFTLGDVSSSTVQGGQGNDVITAVNVYSSIINGNKNTDTITATAVSGGSIFGGQGTDTLNINGAQTTAKIQGDNDDDTLTIGSTTNGSTINGNSGNDTITLNQTQFGTSTVYGGSGNDTITAAGATAGVVISADLGNNNVTGSGAADTLLSSSGNDTVAGGNGNNTITDSAGTNTLSAGAGLDTITGGSGNDSITGGTSADNLTGASGTDSFYQAAGASNAATGTANAAATTDVLAAGQTFTIAADVITDFSVAQGDIIRGNGSATYAAVNIGATTALTVSQNYSMRGSYASATGVFTVNGTGNDLLFFQAATVALSSATVIGTSNAVLSGAGALTLVGGTNVLA